LNEQDLEVIIPKIDEMAIQVIKEDESFRGKIDRKQVVDELINDLTGFGPINPLLADPDISEVMVNGPSRVYVEKKGKIELTDVQFRDDEHVMNVIDKIVAPIGRRIDESSPMVDARLPDGSRVNAIIPPLSLAGPTITIRKFAQDPFQIEDLIQFGTMSREMATFLEACVRARLNTFISGGTGSGKTTTLNVLSSFIPNDERIITIEDSAELQLWQDHVVSLESRPPNIEGKGAITIRELVRNSLRMRPDRVVVGEVRGGEALDMLQAMNTGHDGSLATGHSNSPRDMISRLETMVLLAGIDLPIRAIREQIAGAIDIIIQQTRLKDGTRKIVNITEVQGLEGDIIVLQDIFTFKQEGLDEQGKIIGRLAPTGVRPKFYERLENSGIHIPASVFIESEEWV
jgi:pilus assembly protein CpaF